MEQQMTPWFVNGEKPEMPGVYNVSCRKQEQTGRWWARWDGKTWYTAARGLEYAHSNNSPTTTPNFWHKKGSWRGLAQDPSGKT